MCYIIIYLYYNRNILLIDFIKYFISLLSIIYVDKL